MTKACLLYVSFITFMAIISQKNHSIGGQFDVKKSLQSSNKNLQNVHQKSYPSEVKRRSKSFLVEHNQDEKNLTTNCHAEAMLSISKSTSKRRKKSFYVHQKSLTLFMLRSSKIHSWVIQKTNGNSSKIYQAAHKTSANIS